MYRCKCLPVSVWRAFLEILCISFQKCDLGDFFSQPRPSGVRDLTATTNHPGTPPPVMAHPPSRVMAHAPSPVMAPNLRGRIMMSQKKTQFSEFGPNCFSTFCTGRKLNTGNWNFTASLDAIAFYESLLVVFTPLGHRVRREKIVYPSRFVRVILAQGPCLSSLYRSNFNG